MIKALTRVLEAGLSERRNVPLGKLDEFMGWMVSGSASWSGANVTASTVMQNDVFWAAVNVRASSLAQLPLVTYRVREKVGQDKAYDHYLYPVLRRRFNPYMTAFTGKRQMETWLCVYGNAYAWMDINGRGQTTAIWPWHPSRVEVEWRNWDGATIPFYGFRHDDNSYTWQPYFNIIHLRGPSLDGFFGMNVVETHRNTVGFSSALMEHGSRFFSNGAAIRGIIRPVAGARLDPTHLEESKARWNEQNSGLSNAHKTAFLPASLEFQPISMSMKDADYAALMQMTPPQICRVVGVPPHKVFDLARSTNNNIEHQDLEWLRDYLGPQLTNWEDELNGALLSPREAEWILIEFLINYLMRADVKTRAEYLTKALGGAPWMTQNEGRDKEGFNPQEDPAADKFPVTNNAPGGPEPEPNAQED